MSIVTDALNRVQAERARPTPSPEVVPEPESPPSPPSPKSKPFSPPPPSRTIRNILRWSLIIVGVVAIGIGGYLWGLTLMPDVAKVSPEHEVIPERMSELPSEEQVPSSVAEALPVQTQKEENLEASSAVIGDKSDSASTEGESRPSALPMAKMNESSKPPSEQVASLAKASPTVSERLVAPVAPSSPVLQKQEPSQNAESVSSETPKPLSPDEPQVSATNSPANSSIPKNPPTPQISRNATKTEATLIQAKYLIKKRRYQHAVIILKPMFVTPPDTWEPWFWLGTAQLGLEQFEKAEESFLEGLSRNAAIPHLWVQRALVSQQRGLYGEAVEALRQAELIAPDLPEVQLNLAFSLEAQGHIADAMRHYQVFLTVTEGMKSYQSARKKVLDRIIRLEKV